MVIPGGPPVVTVIVADQPAPASDAASERARIASARIRSTVRNAGAAEPTASGAEAEILASDQTQARSGDEAPVARR
jgi:hypothetical protein